MAEKDDKIQIGFANVFKMVFVDYKRFLHHYIAKDEAPAWNLMIFFDRLLI